MGSSISKTEHHSNDEIFEELEMLRDLFARRLLADKVKKSLIDNLTQSNEYLIKVVEEKSTLEMANELILICDRIYNKHSPDTFTESILDELLEVLARRGIYQITQLGTFDPKIHNVVSTLEADDKFPTNVIVTVVRHGYIKNEKVVRPADVTVAISSTK